MIPDLVRPCGCAGVTTSAPSYVDLVHAFAHFGLGNCPAEWIRVSDVYSDGTRHIELNAFLEGFACSMEEMADGGMYLPDGFMWLAAYVIPRSSTDLFCGVQLQHNRFHLVWDPCHKVAGSFHGNRLLVEYLLSETRMSA